MVLHAHGEYTIWYIYAAVPLDLLPNWEGVTRNGQVVAQRNLFGRVTQSGRVASLQIGTVDEGHGVRCATWDLRLPGDGDVELTITHEHHQI